MDGNPIEKHLHVLRAVMGMEDSVDEALVKLSSIIPPEYHDAVRAAYHAQTSTKIKVHGPVVLSGEERPSWIQGHETSQGFYWRRQRDFLAHALHRRDFEIDSLDQSTDKILSYLGDPKKSDPFSIRGLAIGYVQSGKTQNFSALTAKAADAGYKIVIVLSGLHNTLRQQTQRRLQRDLGRENFAGVGDPGAGRRWQWMTGAELWEDFSPNGVSSAVLQGNEQVIFVVKKNKSRLETLVNWMEDAVPDTVPVLVIDDEADQASVNTGGNRAIREDTDFVEGDDYPLGATPSDELNPSAINLEIRRLLNHFAQCSYVAYTATPFANVLIDPEAYDDEGGRDLFPRSFIASLPEPPGDQYVGPVQLFGRDRLPGDGSQAGADGLAVIEFVPPEDVELLLPSGRERHLRDPELPDTLRAAIVDYVLAAGARLAREKKDVPCTMLIHTGMQRAMQNPLKPQVQAELASIRQRWLYEREKFRPELEKRWNDVFRPVTSSLDVRRDCNFGIIESSIDGLLRQGIYVMVLNSDSDDVLDFDSQPNLKAVLIGGNKLSRGVTVEGLLTSYFVRETLYYDTLMQMGRWFGYRASYVDLTRIYSTALLVECFHDIATAEAELRRQVIRYERDGLTPKQAVPKIRKHPVMAVTQKAKMQNAEDVSWSYQGQLVQTLRFSTNWTEGQQANLNLTRSFFAQLGQPREEWRGKPAWSELQPEVIIDYLHQFQLLSQASIDKDAVIDYINSQRAQGELTQWRVLLSCGSEAMASRDGGNYSDDLGLEGQRQIPLVSRSRMKNDPSSLGVITDPSDERHGIPGGQLFVIDHDFEQGDLFSRADAYRRARPAKEGLLIVYPISAFSKPGRNAKNRRQLYDNPASAGTLVGFALSFPASSNAATIEYVSAPNRQGEE